MARKFGFGIEDLQDGDEEVIVPATDEVVEPVEVVEFTDDEIEGGTQADVIEDAIEQVEDVAEGLEAIKEQMIAALAQGGMSSETAQMAQLAIHGVSGRWVRPSKTLPSMESFTDEGRVTATNFAIEGVTDMIKASWAKVKALAEKFIQALVKVYTDLIVTAKLLEKRANEVASRAEKHGGKPEKEKLTLSSTEHRNLTIDGSAKEATAALLAITAVVSELTETSPIVEILTGLVDGLVAVDRADLAKTESELDNLVKKYGLEEAVAEFQKLSTLKFKAAPEKEYKDTNLVKYLVLEDTLIGDKSILVTFIGTPWVGTSVFLKTIKCTMIDIIERKGADSADVEALTAEETVALAKAVAATANAIVTSKTSIKDSKEAMEKLISKNEIELLEFWEALPEVAEGDKATEFLKAIKGYLQAFYDTTGELYYITAQPNLDILRQAMVGAKAGYNYAVKSLNNLKVVVEETPAEGAATTEE